MASFKENIPLGLAMVACGIYKTVDLAEKKKKLLAEGLKS